MAQGQGSAEPGWRDRGREGCAGAGAPVRAARSICLTHEDPHLLLPEDPRKERGHGEAHGGARGRGHGHGHGGAGWNRPVAGGWGSAAAGGGGAATASARPGPPDVTAAPPPPGRPPPRPAPRPPRGSGSGETEAERVSAARLRAPPARRRKGSGFPTWSSAPSTSAAAEPASSGSPLHRGPLLHHSWRPQGFGLQRSAHSGLRLSSRSLAAWTGGTTLSGMRELRAEVLVLPCAPSAPGARA